MPTELIKSRKLALELTMGVFDCSLGKEGEIISNTEKHGKKIYNKSLFSYSDYLKVKQEFIELITGSPYNWKIELEEGLEVIKDYRFRYNPNSCLWEFDRIRQKHWMDGFTEEEREKIKKCLKFYQENSQRLKKEILNNLSSWSAGCFWIFNDKEKTHLHNGIKERAGNFWYKGGWSGKELSREDYQEVRNALVKNVIDIVKQNPHEWRIQNVCTFNGDMPDFKYMGGYQEWEEILVHHSIPSQYGWEWKHDFEKHKRKVFWRGTFSNKEWAEIERVVKKQPQIPFKEDKETKNLTQQELKEEVQKVKSEIEGIKNNKNMENSEKQAELQKREAKLEKLLSANTTQKPNSGNNFPTGWVVRGGIIMLMIVGLITILIRKKRRVIH